MNGESDNTINFSELDPTHVLYGFTVKDNRAEQTDYSSYFDHLARCGAVVTAKYPERDTKGILHWHGIMIIKKNTWMRRLNYAPLHTWYEPIYDKKGWDKYIRKQQPRQVHPRVISTKDPEPSTDGEDTNDPIPRRRMFKFAEST